MVILKRPQSAMLFRHHANGGPGQDRFVKPPPDSLAGKAAQEKARAGQHGSGSRTMEQKSLTILVVDDDDFAMKTGCAIVERMGHEFKTAVDGREGLEVFRQGGIDLVLSDRQMPNMDGLQLLKELKKLDPDVKVIVVSGNMGDEDKAELYGAGAVAVMDKPYMMKELMETISKSLE